jgi:FKBP-type peptidyl-prolyl cis-trans isomerase FkpA
MKTSVLALSLAAALLAQAGLADNAPVTPSNTAVKTAATVKELQIIDLEQGKGAEAKTTGPVWVHYTGWLHDPAAPEHKGKRFDSSESRPTPFGFFLGVGRVIKGWDKGVPGMKVGGKRRLIIPAAMAYGEKGAGGVIPPNAALVFDIELVDLK